MNRHWNSYLNQKLSRRKLLQVSSAGFGNLALAGLMAEQQARAASADPLGPRQARHLPVHARRPVTGGHLRLQAAA
jgi:hypothetical protein